MFWVCHHKIQKHHFNTLSIILYARKLTKHNKPVKERYQQLLDFITIKIVKVEQLKSP